MRSANHFLSVILYVVTPTSIDRAIFNESIIASPLFLSIFR